MIDIVDRNVFETTKNDKL